MAQAAATFSAPKKKIKVSAGRRVFVVFNYIFCFLVGMICLVPVLHILAVSFSGIDAVVSNKVTLWPIDFNLENYEIVVGDAQFFRSYLVTFLRAIVGWAVSMLMTVLASYPMSLRQSAFPKRKYFVWYFMGTMLFNGGMIPTYLAMKSFGLLNSPFAVIFPGAVNVTNLIIARTYFATSIPWELQEAATIDGANRWKQTWHITLPGMRMIIVLMMVLSLGNVLNAGFDQVYNMYSPIVYETGDIIDTMVYRLGLENAKYGPAAAVSIFKSVVSMLFISVSYYVADRFFDYRLF